MRVKDIKEQMALPPDMEDPQREAKFWILSEFSGGASWVGSFKGASWVGSFKGASNWERHTAGDEFLYVLKGSVDITLITESGPATVTVASGSSFVVPRGLWHKQDSKEGVVEMGATPGKTDERVDEPSYGA